ncbi:glycosyltransferase [Sulfuracidifex tepidarius]|uniref:Glycosyltransferase AglE n=1 Tax=Sulfuracidifex tepidarius TaxID=1294262 RepID=A0A510E5D7_9CREN|nr:glycosyltransferase [Sulfuracidifex tepidarius]BBG27657.1 Glycosyltransferase AglE [Sulfuracidifex tepidarius]
MLDIGLSLLAIHFTEPLSYFAYIKNKKLDLKENEDLPPVSVIIPSYNEKDKIREKIMNVLESYPREKVELVIVDSSDDGTFEEIRNIQDEISSGMSYLQIPRMKIIKTERRGKIFAIKEGVKASSNNIVLMTDVDAKWNDPLQNAIKYLHGEVGAVSCIKHANSSAENSYRDFYNVLRMGESAIHSSPIFHGEMTAFRKDVLSCDEIPIVGADDSTIATITALKGYRAVCVNMRAYELAPSGMDYVRWKARRGSHLIIHFTRYLPKVLKSENKKFKKVFAEEAYLHLINPWILVVGFAIVTLSDPILSLLMLSLLGLLYVPKKTRNVIKAWFPNQIFLIIAQMYALFKGEVKMWSALKK